MAKVPFVVFEHVTLIVWVAESVKFTHDKRIPYIHENGGKLLNKLQTHKEEQSVLDPGICVFAWHWNLKTVFARHRDGCFSYCKGEGVRQSLTFFHCFLAHCVTANLLFLLYKYRRNCID